MQRATTIANRLAPKGLAAEVGVLIGQTSEALLGLRKDARLIMVDSWAPMTMQPEQYKATGDTHAFHDLERVARHRAEATERAEKFPKRATILALPSLEAAATIENGALDLVFLDADHSYEGVRDDIAAWLPKIHKGGWIGGHDYGNDNAGFQFGVTRAVDEWIAATGHKLERDLNFTWFVRV